MRIVMFMASKYGLDCYNAVKEIENVKIAGILTTLPHFVLRYEKNKTKEMDNAIYQDVIEESEKKGTPVYAAEKMNDEQTVNIVKSWQPDLIVVSGWYHIIKDKILQIPSKGIIGLHSSLLPRYRGGAPLVWQLINGEKKSGITLFYMGEGTDTGDIIGQKEVEIEENDDIRTLYEKVGEQGIELLKEYIPQIENNCAPRTKQEDIEKYKIYPQRKKEDGQIDWSKSPVDIYNFVRAQTKPYPGAFSIYDGYQVSIWKCKIVTMEDKSKSAGTIVDITEEGHPVVSTGNARGGAFGRNY